MTHDEPLEEARLAAGGQGPEDEAGPPPDDVKTLASDEHWPRTNARRHELIRKEFEGGISPEELRELEHLQAVVAERAAPRDRVLLAFADEFRRQAEALLHAPKH